VSTVAEMVEILTEEGHAIVEAVRARAIVEAVRSGLPVDRIVRAVTALACCHGAGFRLRHEGAHVWVEACPCLRVEIVRRLDSEVRS
jgi:hypothetical protein